jgi:hypothetical protein
MTDAHRSSNRPIITWLAKVAAALRERDLPVSSAHIIEATRLAEALAALRGRSLPGLGEVTEATRAVLCEGDDQMVAFIQQNLVVGEELGEVPEGAPLVPLDADLRKTAKTLRLAFSAAEKEITLDLRKDFDRQKSALLHRLEILGIGWGNRGRNPGTERSRRLGRFAGTRISRSSWSRQRAGEPRSNLPQPQNS